METTAGPTVSAAQGADDQQEGNGHVEQDPDGPEHNPYDSPDVPRDCSITAGLARGLSTPQREDPADDRDNPGHQPDCRQPADQPQVARGDRVADHVRRDQEVGSLHAGWGWWAAVRPIVLVIVVPPVPAGRPILSFDPVVVVGRHGVLPSQRRLSAQSARRSTENGEGGPQGRPQFRLAVNVSPSSWS